MGFVEKCRGLLFNRQPKVLISKDSDDEFLFK